MQSGKARASGHGMRAGGAARVAMNAVPELLNPPQLLTPTCSNSSLFPWIAVRRQRNVQAIKPVQGQTA